MFWDHPLQIYQYDQIFSNKYDGISRFFVLRALLKAPVTVGRPIAFVVVCPMLFL